LVTSSALPSPAFLKFQIWELKFSAIMRHALFALFWAITATAIARTESPVVELRDGDRIVLLGSTLAEREWKSSYLETALTVWNADKKLVFRNLGWSGDNVWGDARASFGNRDEGFKQLQDRIAEVKPTIIFILYGTNESYAGPAGIPEFTVGLNKLVDVLQANRPRQIVLFSPLAHEKLAPPLPDPAATNQNLQLYGNAIKQIASERGCSFVDLFAISSELYQEHSDAKLTTNGMHLNDAGSRRVSLAIAKKLQGETRTLYVESNEPLRQVIIAKNRLFFHRWRPQNHVYIFGFRKSEQGHNAIETLQFDPLIEKAEAEIHKLAQSVNK